MDEVVFLFARTFGQECSADLEEHIAFVQGSSGVIETITPLPYRKDSATAWGWAPWRRYQVAGRETIARRS